MDSDHNLPSKPPVVFSYGGIDFSFDDRGFINLTEMWRANGSPANQSPYEWRRTAGKEFIDGLAVSLNTEKSRVMQVGRGKGATTWAHWQIGLAYAKYLSHEFHRAANEAFKAHVEEEAKPDLKMERAIDAYRRKGWTDQKITRRFKGIVARKSLTSTMADHNCKIRGSDNPFAEATRSISLQVLGKTPSEIKVSKGLAKSASTRDHLDEDQLLSIEWAELQARKLIQTEASDGNAECVDACRRAGRAIRLALDSLTPQAKAS